jgi:hypothetical protein
VVRTYLRASVFPKSQTSQPSGGFMIDIIQAAWNSASECSLLAESATDATARKFFRKLADNWERVARNYESLAKNDSFLAELSCACSTDLEARP